MIDQLEKYIKKNYLFDKTNHLLVAVSGGVDSVVLVDILSKAGYTFSIAHCNFQLRGAESERDENFVKEIGEKYGVKLFLKKFDTAKVAEEEKKSIQVTARNLRYAWFNELLQDPPFNKSSRLVTAHHADDNIETVLMNFFKGTGVSGFHGILPLQGKIARPLLFVRKMDIVQYAQENNLKWVEDISNSSDKYTRNFFRHHIIPKVEDIIPTAANNVINTIERMKDVEQLYLQAIQQIKSELLEQKGNEWHIPVLKLSKMQPLKTITYEIIKDFGFSSSQTNEVLDLLNSHSGKYVASNKYRIIRNRAWLIIAPNQTKEISHILIEEDTSEVNFHLGKIELKTIDGPIGMKNNSNISLLDAKHISFPLLLRPWKTGDYFYPLGMKKKKKLNRFFIDQKISTTEKENIWVIESNKKILWIIGHRIDDRFKITDHTKKVLRIEFQHQ